MKKTFCFSAVILILIHVFLLLPQSAKADESLTIPEWVVDAYLLENGDLQIVEDITFQFNDYFNGVFREIVLNKTSGIADIYVDEITDSTLIPFVSVEDAENGDSGVFTAKMKNGKTIVKIFSPSDDVRKTFRVRYTIKNVAIRYNDTAELYYQFLGDENATPIGRFRVNITLPQSAAENQVNVFAHGPLNGIIRKESDAVYSLYVEDVPPDTFIEGRVVFPKDFIPMSNNVQSKDNYANILEEEASFQKRQAEGLEREKRIRRILGQISMWASVFGSALFSLLLILFRREKNIYQYDEYDGRSIPEECSPAVAAYLTGTVISTNTIFATILDLVRRGFASIGKVEEDSGTKNRKQDFIITKLREQDDSILEHERHFMNWLFHEIGDDRTVTTQQIETFSQERSTKFSGLYYNWKGKVRSDAVKKGYYDRSKVALGIILLIVSVSLFLLSIFTLIYENLYGLACLVLSFTLFIYGLILINRRSDYGYGQYTMWLQFKKYMKSYKTDSFNEEMITEEMINEETGEDSDDVNLIYALGLDIRKSLKDFRLDKSDITGEGYSYNGWMPWYFIYISSNNSFRRSINKSFGSSGSSDSSSSGGSFSGGGGGGAGGGGAGGF